MPAGQSRHPARRRRRRGHRDPAWGRGRLHHSEWDSSAPAVAGRPDGLARARGPAPVLGLYRNRSQRSVWRQSRARGRNSYAWTPAGFWGHGWDGDCDVHTPNVPQRRFVGLLCIRSRNVWVCILLTARRHGETCRDSFIGRARRGRRGARSRDFSVARQRERTRPGRAPPSRLQLKQGAAWLTPSAGRLPSAASRAWPSICRSTERARAESRASHLSNPLALVQKWKLAVREAHVSPSTISGVSAYVNPDRIGIAGYSLGAYLSVIVAATMRRLFGPSRSPPAATLPQQTPFAGTRSHDRRSSPCGAQSRGDRC